MRRNDATSAVGTRPEGHSRRVPPEFDGDGMPDRQPFDLQHRRPHRRRRRRRAVSACDGRLAGWPQGAGVERGHQRHRCGNSWLGRAVKAQACRHRHGQQVRDLRRGVTLGMRWLVIEMMILDRALVRRDLTTGMGVGRRLLGRGRCEESRRLRGADTAPEQDEGEQEGDHSTRHARKCSWQQLFGVVELADAEGFLGSLPSSGRPAAARGGRSRSERRATSAELPGGKTTSGRQGV